MATFLEGSLAEALSALGREDDALDDARAALAHRPVRLACGDAHGAEPSVTHALGEGSPLAHHEARLAAELSAAHLGELARE
jgi:hypothetical protein